MADDYVLYWGILIGSLAAWLLPCLVAALIAKFYSLPSKFKFALTSAVLTYGITCLFVLIQAPLALATNLAPEWTANGHATLANSIASVAEFVGVWCSSGASGAHVSCTNSLAAALGQLAHRSER
jgi:hypothetical protein